MNKMVVFFLLALFILVGQGYAFALDCPKMPEQINKDWEVGVNAAIAKIGFVKGGELKIKTKNATKDLLSKLPDVGKVYLEQMMYSAYCSALRDDKTIKDSEKAKLLREYNREVRKAITTSSTFVHKRDKEPSKSEFKNEPKLQKKPESTASKDMLKPAKPLTDDNSKKQETIVPLVDLELARVKASPEFAQFEVQFAYDIILHNESNVSISDIHITRLVNPDKNRQKIAVHQSMWEKLKPFQKAINMLGSRESKKIYREHSSSYEYMKVTITYNDQYGRGYRSIFEGDRDGLHLKTKETFGQEENKR